MQGVLIVIGGIFLAAMFFVLYIRAISAEHCVASLTKELEDLRKETGRS